MNVRPGHTLAELVVVMPLALLLAALVMTGLMAQTRLARRLTELASRAEAERVTATVLPAELRWAASGDLRSEGPDSVRARVFRGFAVPCGAENRMAWRGIRAPATPKDSLLVIAAGTESVQPLASVVADLPCSGYRLGGPPLAGSIVLVFETGTYYLRDRALRYRVGAEGKQPLSEEWFDDASTALEPAPGGALTALRLGLRHTQAGLPPESRRIRWALPNHPAEAP